jgi:hypothetical protein
VAKNLLGVFNFFLGISGFFFGISRVSKKKNFLEKGISKFSEIEGIFSSGQIDYQPLAKNCHDKKITSRV